MTQTWEQKLNLKPGWHIGVDRAPEEVLAVLKRDLPGCTSADGFSGEEECAILFLRNLADVHSLLPPFFARAADTPVIWLAYPKGSSGVSTDINRDILWKEIAPMGWHPVRQVALDEVWSMLRFKANTVEG